jgi:AhpD family alkylhydroperoxidase
MQPRLKNPAMIIPDAMQALDKSAKNGPVPSTTLEVVHLRASQINGCSSCVDGGSRVCQTGRRDRRAAVRVGAWREAPYFTDGERAPLALTEAVTRLSNGADPVPDEIWDEAARHYDEQALAALILSIATTNVFNRLNATTRQVAGAWG